MKKVRRGNVHRDVFWKQVSILDLASRLRVYMYLLHARCSVWPSFGHSTIDVSVNAVKPWLTFRCECTQTMVNMSLRMQPYCSKLVTVTASKTWGTCQFECCWTMANMLVGMQAMWHTCHWHHPGLDIYALSVSFLVNCAKYVLYVLSMWPTLAVTHDGRGEKNTCDIWMCTQCQFLFIKYMSSTLVSFSLVNIMTLL